MGWLKKGKETEAEVREGGTATEWRLRESFLLLQPTWDGRDREGGGGTEQKREEFG